MSIHFVYYFKSLTNSVFSHAEEDVDAEHTLHPPHPTTPTPLEHFTI